MEILQSCTKPSICQIFNSYFPSQPLHCCSLLSLIECVNGQSWWHHEMASFSVLLALCVGNSPVTGKFPSQRPVTQGFEVFFDLCLNKQLRKQSWGRWFETPLHPLRRHSNVSRNHTQETSQSAPILQVRSLMHIYFFLHHCNDMQFYVMKNSILMHPNTNSTRKYIMSLMESWSTGKFNSIKCRISCSLCVESTSG